MLVSGLDIDVQHVAIYLRDGRRLTHDIDLQYGEINCRIDGKPVSPRVYRETLGDGSDARELERSGRLTPCSRLKSWGDDYGPQMDG